ncbi:MAG TPA: hypothetical protein VK841_15325 [Polyangiaceae bacterium]|nr:hypothetical protein [Polyangiaceae bacterium]
MVAAEGEVSRASVGGFEEPLCVHPDYRSTRGALAFRVEPIAVQHHHAHIASCLVEHGRTGPAIGVVFDGTAWESDGVVWGGEFLVATLDGFRRAGHMRPIALPGGEVAIQQPWRVGFAALLDARATFAPLEDVKPGQRAIVQRMIEQRITTPFATSAGRWFDAVAAIAGIVREISYCGQAAIELEATAADGAHAPYPFAIVPALPDGPIAAFVQRQGPFVVDMRPVVRAIAHDVVHAIPASEISARFHETMAQVIVAGSRRVRELNRVSCVVLSGGCFQNERLKSRVCGLLRHDGFELLVHRSLGAGDGGIAVSEAPIALALIRRP